MTQLKRELNLLEGWADYARFANPFDVFANPHEDVITGSIAQALAPSHNKDLAAIVLKALLDAKVTTRGAPPNPKTVRQLLALPEVCNTEEAGNSPSQILTPWVPQAKASPDLLLLDEERKVKVVIEVKIDAKMNFRPHSQLWYYANDVEKSRSDDSANEGWLAGLTVAEKPVYLLLAAKDLEEYKTEQGKSCKEECKECADVWGIWEHLPMAELLEKLNEVMRGTPVGETVLKNWSHVNYLTFMLMDCIDYVSSNNDQLWSKEDPILTRRLTSALAEGTQRLGDNVAKRVFVSVCRSKELALSESVSKLIGLPTEKPVTFLENSDKYSGPRIQFTIGHVTAKIGFPARDASSNQAKRGYWEMSPPSALCTVAIKTNNDTGIPDPLKTALNLTESSPPWDKTAYWLCGTFPIATDANRDKTVQAAYKDAVLRILLIIIGASVVGVPTAEVAQ